MSTANRSIFITGAASGIGRETARLFAVRGFRVGAADLDEAGLASLAGKIGAERCWTARLDVGDGSAYAETIAGSDSGPAAVSTSSSTAPAS